MWVAKVGEQTRKGQEKRLLIKRSGNHLKGGSPQGCGEKGFGFKPPGVYGNPKKANGKQWDGETGSKRGDAQERATRVGRKGGSLQYSE